MDSGNQTHQTDTDGGREGSPIVDLNQATVEEMRTLPGIGPTLAKRIAAHRAEQGPFQSAEEITTVPGVGSIVYEQLADRLTATPTAGEAQPKKPPSEAEEAGPAQPAKEIPGADMTPADISAPEAEAETPPPKTEVGAEETAPEEPAPEREEEPPAVEEVSTAPREGIAMLPPPIASTRESVRGRRPGDRGLSWLWASLLGGILGMIFTLLVFAGINGSLDLSNSHAVLDVQNQMDNLAAETKSLRGEIEGLRQRLDTLEGLTARLEKAESTVDTLRQETTALDQRTDALESELSSVSENLTNIQTQMGQVTTFFDQLRTLLQETFGEEPTTESTPEAPVETPEPSQ